MSAGWRKEAVLFSIHPLDIVEEMASIQGWSFEREDEQDELVVNIPGTHCTHSFLVTTSPENSMLCIISLLDIKIPEKKASSVLEMCNMINEKLVYGHFDFITHQATVAFRLAHCLSDDSTLGLNQAERLLQSAFEACETLYPALNYHLWSGMTPRDAYDVAKMEPIGCA